MRSCIVDQNDSSSPMTHPLPPSASPPIVETNVEEKKLGEYLGHHSDHCVVVEGCKRDSSIGKMLLLKGGIGDSAYSMKVILGRIQKQSPIRRRASRVDLVHVEVEKMQ